MAKRQRKTIKIDRMIELVNHHNASTADQFKSEREGRNMLLEQLLQDAGAYHGFTYLSDYELSGDAMSVGVREQRPDGTWNFDDTDHTRVKYF